MEDSCEEYDQVEACKQEIFWLASQSKQVLAKTLIDAHLKIDQEFADFYDAQGIVLDKLRRRAPQQKSPERKRDLKSIGEIKKITKKKQEDNELQNIPIRQGTTRISKKATKKQQPEEISDPDFQIIPVRRDLKSKTKTSHKKKQEPSNYHDKFWLKDEEDRFFSAILLHGKDRQKIA